MDVGDRVMVRGGKHGGMVGVLTKVRVGKVKNSKAARIEPVATITHTTTNRTFDELVKNIRPVPTHPFV